MNIICDTLQLIHQESKRFTKHYILINEDRILVDDSSSMGNGCMIYQVYNTLALYIILLISIIVAALFKTRD